MGFQNPREIANAKGAARGIWNSHEDFDIPLNPVTSILNVFFYRLIITCVLCANYKVGEGFEFSKEELGVKVNNKFILKFQAWRFYLRIYSCFLLLN